MPLIIIVAVMFTHHGFTHLVRVTWLLSVMADTTLKLYLTDDINSGSFKITWVIAIVK
jgi:hypothetical protein